LIPIAANHFNPFLKQLSGVGHGMECCGSVARVRDSPATVRLPLFSEYQERNGERNLRPEIAHEVAVSAFFTSFIACFRVE
jgi:hypothetical protein